MLGGRNYRRRRIFSALPGVCAIKFSISALGIREIFSKKIILPNAKLIFLDFPVDKRNIALLVEALRVPPIFKCSNGTICDGTEGLCIILKRFAYPCRYSDLMPIFRRSVPQLSLICNQVTDWIYNTHGYKVTRWNHGILNPPLIATYADTVHSKGAALDNCFSFIDGTVWPISRPMSNQRVVYNGNRRVHALKFQAVTLPSALIANIYGPVGKPQIFFLFTKQSFFPSLACLWNFSCILLASYFCLIFLVKFF